MDNKVIESAMQILALIANPGDAKKTLDELQVKTEKLKELTGILETKEKADAYFETKMREVDKAREQLRDDLQLLDTTRKINDDAFKKQQEASKLSDKKFTTKLREIEEAEANLETQKASLLKKEVSLDAREAEVARLEKYLSEFEARLQEKQDALKRILG